MERRDFVATGFVGALGLTGAPALRRSTASPVQDPIRSQFPRLAGEHFLNAAGGTPLGRFAEDGIQRYLDFLRLGPGDGRRDYVSEMWSGVRGRFAALVGARESEIGLVECTKAGEQIVLDRLDALRRGGNVVTNDLHFSGSLHNYEGLRRAGVDVRIVRAGPDLQVPLDRMVSAMDDRTVLVAVSLVSNVNGHVEPMAALAGAAHARGALVFADIIQAAGALPLDLPATGVDVAACSSYKWLLGLHGAGFLYVRDGVQGAALPDRLFPGHVQRGYAPWTAEPAPPDDPYSYRPPTDATRYQPGHVSYVGYAAVYEALGWLESVGGPAAVARHTTGLLERLLARIDTDRYRVMSPLPLATPILALRARETAGLTDRLAAAGVTIAVGGDAEGVLRVSPGIYSNEEDIERLAEALDGER